MNNVVQFKRPIVVPENQKIEPSDLKVNFPKNLISNNIVTLNQPKPFKIFVPILEKHVRNEEFFYGFMTLYMELDSGWFKTEKISKYLGKEGSKKLHKKLLQHRSNDIFNFPEYFTGLISKQAILKIFANKACSNCEEHYLPRTIGIRLIFEAHLNNEIQTPQDLLDFIIKYQMFFVIKVTSEENIKLRPFQNSNNFIDPFTAYKKAGLLNEIYYIDRIKFDSEKGGYYLGRLNSKLIVNQLGIEKVQEIIEGQSVSNKFKKLINNINARNK